MPATRRHLVTFGSAIAATALLLAAASLGDPTRAAAWPTLALVAVAMSVGVVAVLRAWDHDPRNAQRSQPEDGHAPDRHTPDRHTPDRHAPDGHAPDRQSADGSAAGPT